MRVKTTAGVLALALLISLASGAAALEKGFIWNGNQWQGLSFEVKVGYMKGLGNLADYEVAIAGSQKSTPLLARAIEDDLKNKSIQQAVQEIDAFYQKNPDRLSTPVIDVVVRNFPPVSASGAKK